MSKDILTLAREAGLVGGPVCARGLERFAELVRADERKACAKKTEEFARKWWKIHCDSNLHYSLTLKAHQDFCALQAAIRARSNT